MRRLFTWLMAAFVSVVLLSTLVRTMVLSISLRASRQTASVQTAREDAGAIAAWAQERWDRPADDIRLSLGALARVADARVWLVDRSGLVRVDTLGNPSWEGVAVRSAELQQALTGEATLMEGPSPWLDTAISWVVPVVREGQVLGAVALFLPAPSADPAGGLTGTLVWSAAIGVSLAVAVAYAASRSIAAPAEALTAYARSLGEGRFGIGPSIRSIQELQVLAETLTDVSGRLKASFDTLGEERQRLAAILESMQEGVLATDGAGRLMMANPAAVRLLQWTATPALPAAPGEVLLPERLGQALRDGLDGHTTEVSFLLRGSEEILAICAPVAGTDGRVAGATAVLRDLSSVMRLQRVRENFIADVAHELRGPLANLSLLAEAFGDQTIPWEGRAPFVQSLQGEVARLRRLSFEVLDLAQLDAGVMSMTPEATLLAGSVTAAAGRLADAAASAGVDLQSLVGGDLWVSASALRLDQVVSNLLENALRYTPEGGSITVKAAPEGGRVCLSIADTGRGIPPEHLPFIFERFYKADPARTRDGAGTGLGLAVVKQLVELQGGQVDVRSEPGRGTEFRVWLQATEPRP
jgi:signal transduction histidine kinase